MDGCQSLFAFQKPECVANLIASYPEADGLYEMGGRGTEDHDHIVTETAIRAFYKVYREVMGL